MQKVTELDAQVSQDFWAYKGGAERSLNMSGNKEKVALGEGA